MTSLRRSLALLIEKGSKAQFGAGPWSASQHLATARACRSGFSTATTEAGKDILKEARHARAWGLSLLFPAVVTSGLGTWQLHRMAEKEDLIERRRSGLAAEPIPVLDLPDDPPEYLPVVATGRFEHRRALYVGPRVKHIGGRVQLGYNLVVPFRTSDGRAVILVNRGWVPKAYRDYAEVRQRYEKFEDTTIRAYVARSEKGPGFAKVYSDRQDLWLWVDIPAMTSTLGLPADTPLITVLDDREEPVGQEAMDGMGLGGFGHRNGAQEGPRQEEASQSSIAFPVGKSMNDLLKFPLMPEGHLGYAFTWYGICLVAIVMSVRSLRRARELALRGRDLQFTATSLPPRV